MCPDFKTTLAQCGFYPDTYDCEQSTLGFAYDVDFAVHGADTCFDYSRTAIHRRPWDLNSMLVVDLWTLPGLSLPTGVTFLYRKWMDELRYQNPVVELMDTRMNDHTGILRVLMVSDSNAITMSINLYAG